MAFNPLPSHEGRQERSAGKDAKMGLSIHFPLTREDLSQYPSFSSRSLSIHFPLTREDPFPECLRSFPELSIHFPLTREDGLWQYICWESNFFQSTSLSRGKTSHSISFSLIFDFQSTSLSRGKTGQEALNLMIAPFQSTSLSRGKTPGIRRTKMYTVFQSTSLSRGKTAKSTDFPFQNSTFFRHILQTHNI